MSLTLGFRPPVRDQLVGRTPPFGVAGAMGRMVITVLGMVADMELTFIRDRQHAGIKAAKGKGVYKGREKRVDDAKLGKLASDGVSKARIARDLGVSRMTVPRALEARGTTAGPEDR